MFKETKKIGRNGFSENVQELIAEKDAFRGIYADHLILQRGGGRKMGSRT